MNTNRLWYRFLLSFLVLTLLSFAPVRVNAASPAAPKLKTVTSVSYKSVKITWNKVKGATGYEVLRKTGTGNFKKVGTTKKASYTDKKLKCGTQYTYTVRAYKTKSGKKTYSAYDKVGKTIVPVPAVSKKLTAASSNTSATLSWSKVAGASGYIVYRSTDGKNFSPIQTVAKTTYTDTGLSNGKYYYQICAYRTVSSKQVEGGRSAAASCTIQVSAQTNDSYTDFAKAISQAISSQPTSIGESSAAAAGDEFYTNRLILKAKSGNLSFSKYNPVSVVSGPDNDYFLTFANSKDTRDAYSSLCNDPSVIFVEPDEYTVLDPEPSTGLNAEDWLVGSEFWDVDAIGAEDYANYISTKGKGRIVVAVVDTGVGRHSYFDGRLVKGYDFIDNDEDPSDLNSHGTHVAGTILACMPNLDVYIMPVRVLNKNGRGSKVTTALGIKWAVEHGANVINLSLGGSLSQYQDYAVEEAISKGVTVVCAVGNEGDRTENRSPSHIMNAIVVGNINSSNVKHYSSNFGSSLDLVAPGTDIKSTVPGNNYALKTGTSMSSPHIAAAAAMIKLMNPSYTPAQIEKELKSICTDLGDPGYDYYYGYGIPDLRKLILAANPNGISLNNNTLSLKVGEKQTLSIVNNSGITVKNPVWTSSNTNVAAVSDKGVVEGKNPGTAEIKVTTSIGYTASCTVTVEAAEILPASITISHPQLTMQVGNTFTLSAQVSPNQASNKTVYWSSSNTNIVTVDRGVVTAVAPGNAYVYAQTVNGIVSKCQVTVSAPTAAVNAIIFPFSTLAVELGKSYTVDPIIDPSSASEQTLTWLSSDPSVATVSNGRIITIKSGITVIGAQAPNGLYATFTLFVNNRLNYNDGKSLSNYYDYFKKSENNLTHFAITYLDNDSIPEVFAYDSSTGNTLYITPSLSYATLFPYRDMYYSRGNGTLYIDNPAGMQEPRLYAFLYTGGSYFTYNQLPVNSNGYFSYNGSYLGDFVQQIFSKRLQNLKYESVVFYKNTEANRKQLLR